MLLESFDQEGDLWALLGGDRINGPPPSTDATFDVIINPTNVVVRGLYPMQRSTDYNVYLRCSQLSTNIETASLSPQFPPYGQMSQNSTILARIPIDIEFTAYEAESLDMFKMILPQRTLSYLTLFLSDHKGRPLNRPLGSTSETATGGGTHQSTLGNLFFGCTISIEVLQSAPPNQIRFPRPLNPALPNDTALPLSHLDSDAYITNDPTRNGWAQNPTRETGSAPAHNIGMVGKKSNLAYNAQKVIGRR